MATETKTREQVIAAFQAALVAGNRAGNVRIQELATRPDPGRKMLEECGGSILHLAVDGRTGMGKILARIGEPKFSVLKDIDSGFIANIRYDLKMIPPVNGQEFSIHYDADKAAGKVFQEQLGIPTYVWPYID